MESAEQFMRRYIAGHIVEEQRQQASREHFHHRFFVPDCIWGSRPGTLESLQSETLENISNTDGKVEVITRRQLPLSEDDYFIRYHLERHGDNWMIFQVDLQCCPCDGKPGNNGCPRCHGTGWMNTNLAISNIKSSHRKPEAEKVRT